MTTQQPDALIPDEKTVMAQAQVYASTWAIVGSRFDAGDCLELAEQEKTILADMVRRLGARITELESQLAQRFDAADMATAAAQGFRDGAASVSAQAADRAIENCPELNMGNYDEVDVERLKDWAIRAHDEIDRLHALAAGQATAAQPAAPKNPWLGALEIRMAQGWRLKGDRLPVLYTDTINGDGVCRDDLWLCTGEALKPVAEPAKSASHGQAPAETGNSVSAQADSVQEDAARLDWLLLRVSGAEFRRIGVHYSGNARRADVDAARKQGGGS